MKITGIETLSRRCRLADVLVPQGHHRCRHHRLVGVRDTRASAAPGSRGVIEALAPIVIGRDPRPTEQVVSTLHVLTRQSRGGLTQQAIAAIENALLDIKGKDLGVPVYALFGGPVRERIPVYWSHAGTYRVRNAALLGVPELRRLRRSGARTARKSASAASRR